MGISAADLISVMAVAQAALLPLKWLAGRRARSIRPTAFDMPSTVAIIVRVRWVLGFSCSHIPRGSL